jgi:hypothetical protein
MTTPRPDDFISIAGIKDRASLQLVGRMIESQRTMLEAQIVQMNEMHEAVQARLKGMK